jgi:hypothetical protein
MIGFPSFSPVGQGPYAEIKTNPSFALFPFLYRIVFLDSAGRTSTLAYNTIIPRFYLI